MTDTKESLSKITDDKRTHNWYTRTNTQNTIKNQFCRKFYNVTPLRPLVSGRENSQTTTTTTKKQITERFD